MAFRSDLYEGTRPARLDDLSGIRGLLEPLERSGVLVQRTKAQVRVFKILRCC